MYAYTATSYRAIAEVGDALPGESVANEVPASVLAAIVEQQARDRRNALLRSSDWTQLTDNVLTETQRTEWADYRQQLRDLPEQPEFPENEWPVPPALPQGVVPPHDLIPD